MIYIWKRVTITIILLIFLAAIGAVAQPAEKITICHYPPGNINNPQTIEIAPNALNAHIGTIGHASGLDYTGPCKGLTDMKITGRINNEVPEFPSIALPVAGAMGMVFIFSRMKKGT